MEKKSFAFSFLFCVWWQLKLTVLGICCSITFFINNSIPLYQSDTVPLSIFKEWLLYVLYYKPIKRVCTGVAKLIWNWRNRWQVFNAREKAGLLILVIWVPEKYLLSTRNHYCHFFMTDFIVMSITMIFWARY